MTLEIARFRPLNGATLSKTVFDLCLAKGNPLPFLDKLSRNSGVDFFIPTTEWQLYHF